MKPERTRALYAGSFDPITRGHLDIIHKALTTFDVVHVGVGTNPLKSGLFAAEQRLELIAASVADIGLAGAQSGRPLPDQLEVGAYVGESVIKYARRIGATHLVRGLRQASPDLDPTHEQEAGSADTRFRAS